MMKNAAKRFLTLYYNRWWLPCLLFLILLGGFTVTATLHWKPLAIVAKVLFCIAGVAFLGVISASIWNLIKKRWANGVINLLLVPVCCAAAIFAFAFVFLMTDPVSGPGEDGFADDLEIPADAEIVEPGEKLDAQSGAERDEFQAQLLAALQAPGGKDTTVSGNISPLLRLKNDHPDILRRYLASSPAWRVFEERGNDFATRRWKFGSQWRYNLHGYYTRHDVAAGQKNGIPEFQVRFTIGLSGKPWGRDNKDTTWLNTGEAAKVTLSTGNQMHESHCVISTDAVVAEVFEQSGARERRLTKAALDFLQAELQPLAENPSWETARRILPPDSIRKGEPSFEIRNASQPGVYDSMIWVNPGEPGTVYLKAFEVTRGTPLSVDRLQEKSNERIGWSGDPEELFFSNTQFTIYEGEPGKPYAARLEVWFVPDSGGTERKLLEKVFKIEGWQR
ncbi:MAG: hypothetical protein R6X08_07535 [Desulfosalsimonadaceae bacterium]